MFTGEGFSLTEVAVMVVASTRFAFSTDYGACLFNLKQLGYSVVRFASNLI